MVNDALCLNCNTTISPQQKYCPGCGQDQTIKELVLSDLIKTALREFLDVDGPWMQSFRGIYPEAGKIAQHYVLGQRRSYVHPVKLLITVLVIFIAINELVGMGSVQDLSTPELDYQAVVFALVICPIIAAFLRILFFDSEPTMAEALVLIFYTTSGIFIPLWILDPLTNLLSYIDFMWGPQGIEQGWGVLIAYPYSIYMMLIVPLYCAYSFKEFFQCSWWRSILSSYAAALFGVGTWALIRFSLESFR